MSKHIERPKSSDRRREQSRTLIRPVSRISVTLTDVNAWHSAVKECVSWISNRCAAELPSDAYIGNPFSTASWAGANPAESVCVEMDDVQYWASRLEFPDTDVPQRSWITETVLSDNGSITRATIQLTNITRGPDAPFVHTVPGVSYQLLSRLSVDLDGFAISEVPWQIDEYSYDQFITLLRAPARAPIVCVSVGDDSDSVDSRKIIKRVGGAAHVVVITKDISWRLTEQFGKKYSVFGGAVRIFRDNMFTDRDNYLRHPLWLSETWADEEDLLGGLASNILPLSFATMKEERSISRFEEVREAASKASRSASLSEKENKELNTRNVPDSGLGVAQLLDDLERIREAASDEREAVTQLMDEAAERQRLAEEERDAALAEAARLRYRIQMFEAVEKRGSQEPDCSLDSMSRFEEWYKTHLSGRIYVIPKAIRETKQSLFDDPQFFGESLLFIRDIYVGMRRNECEMYDYIRARSELGLTESPCFEQSGSIKGFPSYRLHYKSKYVWLDRHFKYGSGYDSRRMFRIYFYWDDDEQIIVIGSMPGHLENLKTN